MCFVQDIDKKVKTKINFRGISDPREVDTKERGKIYGRIKDPTFVCKPMNWYRGRPQASLVDQWRQLDLPTSPGLKTRETWSENILELFKESKKLGIKTVDILPVRQREAGRDPMRETSSLYFLSIPGCYW